LKKKIILFLRNIIIKIKEINLLYLEFKFLLLVMVGPERFALPTYSMSTSHSTPELRAQILLNKNYFLYKYKNF
tara:strand:- start:5765 stop:5986 length:222 start_codon:yes stop_codon:yes gene_type:complete